MILRCFKCRDNQAKGAVYQNKHYGSGMRVHNQTANKGQTPNFRCTVCGSERRGES